MTIVATLIAVVPHCPATREVEPILFLCWADVEDGGPTLKQHWLNLSCLLGGEVILDQTLQTRRNASPISIETIVRERLMVCCHKFLNNFLLTMSIIFLDGAFLTERMLKFVTTSVTLANNQRKRYQCSQCSHQMEARSAVCYRSHMSKL